MSDPQVPPLPATTTAAASSPDAEIDAFVAWAQAVLADIPEADRAVTNPSDLSDGVALFQILADIDSDLFRNPHAGDTKDNWVLTIGTLKRLYKLMMQFYSESLQCAPAPLPVPELNAIARSADPAEVAKLCLLAIGIAVQSEKNETHIAAIQTLDQAHQHQLMMSIERIMSLIAQGQEEQQATSLADDSISSSVIDGESDSFDAKHQGKSVAQLAAELEAIQLQKEDVDKSYLVLLEAHRELKNNFQDLQSEKEEIAASHEEQKKQVDAERNDEAAVLMRQEIERLKNDLRRSEDTVAELETDNEKLLQSSEEAKRKIEELQKTSEEATKLKDQMEEYRHAADRLQKAENAIEKYKKKLEEGADVRRQLKTLEDQNAELVDRNAKLEDEYKRVSAFKPLMDSYKSQIADLESKSSNLQRDLSTSKYEQEQILSRLKASEDQRASAKEEMELYQERIKELELGGDTSLTKRKQLVSRNSNASANGVDGLVAADASRASAEDADELEEEEDVLDRSGELDDALSGTTMTDLKIKVRKLSRELEAAKTNKADHSRLIVLENLLEDAQRMKTRYESDYLREHREKMVLQNQLEAIRSGKSDLGDGTEAAFALRLRLNEMVEELDAAKRQATELEVQNEQVARELTIAKSDLTLVNKDQVDILHSLRASVDADKDELEAHIKKLKTELASINEQNRMYMGQVNALLMEKVDLQAEGIGQRDEALKRERTLGELQSRLKGKGLPKEVEEMVASLQSEALGSTRDLKALQERFAKAKTFIKQQDKRIKEKDRSIAAAAAAGSLMGGGAGLEGSTGRGDASYEALDREVRTLRDKERNWDREQRLMMSAYQELGRRYMIELESGLNPSGGGGVGGGAGGSGGGVYARLSSASFSAGGVRALSGLTGLNAAGRSWLVNQRRTVNPTLQLASRR
ncbi:Hook-related protein family [Kalmanozyma brasiliensis GHG001]|uniref:Calponin-homology (CH) domain-containing protein n=1 Tax=Kalmanozyma brasiliensis (strain GHG001) TaxID=1365824 RepID=V5GQY0_KALBG|nr:Hook-related protein family [Kalmanozyma brasiliensis GHG001]EST08352.1 Hook-related protein family [Kalmanozyma brasiliensis GHG001]